MSLDRSAPPKGPLAERVSKGSGLEYPLTCPYLSLCTARDIKPLVSLLTPKATPTPYPFRTAVHKFSIPMEPINGARTKLGKLILNVSHV